MAQLKDAPNFITENLQIRSLSHVKRFAHQQIALQFALSRGKSVLYSGMSTGKTFIALQFMEQCDGLRLIIAPARVRRVFLADYESFYDQKPYDLYVPDLPAKDVHKLLSSKISGVVVLSYEIASKLNLEAYNLSAVVCDEAHRLGKYNAKQSMKLAISCKDVPHKLAMTGTLFHDAYERLYGVLRWLDPVIPSNPRAYPQARIFGHYNDFLRNFCNLYTQGNVQYIKSYKNLNILADLVRPHILMIKTMDVVDLPELVVKSYPYELPKSVQTAYESLEGDAIINLDDDAILAPHILTKMLRLQQLVCSGELETESGQIQRFDVSKRLSLLETLLDQIGQEPAVIFTRFVRDVEIIQATLPIGSYSKLTGNVDTSEDWKVGKTQYLLANVASGSEGVRLDRAHHIIFWSLGYSLKQYAQAVMRIRRNTQHAPTCFIHCIVAENTVDEDIYKAINRKMSDVNELDKLI